MCNGKVIQVGFNDIATSHPDLALTVVDFDPTTFSYGSNKLVKWKCERDHVFVCSPHKRSSQKVGCPLCNGRKVVVGINDLKTRNPEIAVEADGWNPSVYGYSSKEMMSWKCKLGHSYFATISHRRR